MRIVIGTCCCITIRGTRCCDNCLMQFMSNLGMCGENMCCNCVEIVQFFLVETATHKFRKMAETLTSTQDCDCEGITCQWIVKKINTNSISSMCMCDLQRRVRTARSHSHKPAMRRGRQKNVVTYLCLGNIHVLLAYYYRAATVE